MRAQKGWFNWTHWSISLISLLICVVGRSHCRDCLSWCQLSHLDHSRLCCCGRGRFYRVWCNDRRRIRLFHRTFCRLHFLWLIQRESTQVIQFVGQDPGAREEVELEWIKLLQTFQVLGQVGLARDLIHCWKVICLLVGFQRLKFFAVNANIIPVYVELGIGVLTFCYAPVHFLSGNLLD